MPQKESVKPALSVQEKSGAPAALDRSFFDTLDAMERMVHNTVNRALGSFTPFQVGGLFDRIGGLSAVNPTVDIYEEGDHLVVKAELPGIDKNDLIVRLLDNALIISGEKKTERTEGNRDYYRIERSSGSFERNIRLPEGVNTEKATARFRNGILEIRLPKSPEHTVGRKIAIE
jgi:HSP20 family protein